VPTLRLLLIFLLCWISTAQSRETLQLPPVVQRSLDEYRIPPGSVSVYIEDVRTREVVLSHNADVPRSPASTIKALTTFIALDELGPAYTWTTRAYVRGTIKYGVLKGDLYLLGGGDPYIRRSAGGRSSSNCVNRACATSKATSSSTTAISNPSATTGQHSIASRLGATTCCPMR
jgi:D-alanyl-D-alanine carboxypeptidase/D-alanyl-D-alanine-endopeptidase (penicillin-binding protein 4)